MQMSPLLLASPSTASLISFQKTKLPASVSTTSFPRRRSPYVTSKEHQLESNDDAGSRINRRDVFVGGLYGATATFASKAADATPIQAPDIKDTKTCQRAIDPKLAKPVHCCPSYGQTSLILDFKLPDRSEPMRIRKPAPTDSRITEDIEKFITAVQKMKNLPEDDPWNFMQQAQIHCAFCNGGYQEKEFPAVTVQLHGNFLFLPWHRYYLYFWERILGKLIDDPTFAIPFWNWDSPSGMRMPPVYTDVVEKCQSNLKPFKNPLNNYNRNPAHVGGALIDFRYKRGDPNPRESETHSIETQNLSDIYDLFNENLRTPETFLGKPIQEGQVRDAPGSLESLHNTFHAWIGLVDPPNWDMGNFHTAARDTLFYAHHANVDRMWSIYREKRRNKVERFRGISKSDWLDASFIFYDENRNVVKCKVKDCLDETKLRYQYAPVERAWEDVHDGYYREKKALLRGKKRSLEQFRSVGEFGTSPRVLLDSKLSVLVSRPKFSRTKEEKQEEIEVIVIDDFEYDKNVDTRFDVYIAKPIDGLASSDMGEYVGGFNHIAISHNLTNVRNELNLGITYKVDDIEAEESDKLVVTFVPRGGEVTLRGVRIELLPAEGI